MLSILYCERDFLLDVGLRIFSHKIELFHFFQAFASLASQWLMSLIFAGNCQEVLSKMYHADCV